MILTPAAANAIRAQLGITDPTIRIEVTRDNWDAFWCETTGAPAVAEIEWVHHEDGSTSTMLAADQVATHLLYLALADECTETLVVNVSYWWAHYLANPNRERIAA